MNKWFPINFEKIRGIPINSHPGAFGCARKFNFHEGIDLYGKEGDWVYAVRDGIVISNAPFTGPKTGFDWWLDTNAVLIQDTEGYADDRGYYVYGEVHSDLKPGDKVKAGNKIAEIVPVLPPEKFRPDIPEHSVCMLHLERYDHTYDINSGWSSWETREDRPSYLKDPTEELISILVGKYRKPKFLTL